MSNSLGTKSWYKYTSDTGKDYKILMDDTLAASVGAVADDKENDLPRRFKPRGVYIEVTTGGRKLRKFLICPTPNNSNYASDQSQTVLVSGTQFFTTGRRGESSSFGSNRNEGSAGNEVDPA